MCECIFQTKHKIRNSYLFNEFVCNFGFFWHEWISLKLEWNESFKGPRVPKKAQITQERVEYNVFLFDEPLKGSKSLKIFKISLTFRFDKLWHLSKSVHIVENSQILTVSNKKRYFTNELHTKIFWCKNEPLWHFFNASWTIQKSRILWTQTNEKTCTFFDGR
jgi:hypothetical protein